MFSHAVNVVVPHSLGVARAQAAVLAMLESQKGRDPHITWDAAAISNVTHEITITLNAYGVPINATIQIEPSSVTFKTNEVKGVLAVAGSYYAEMEIKSMLAEALK